MSETKPVLWNRNFVQCCISYFLMNFAFYMLMPTMPVYLVEELGISTSEVGIVLSSYTIGLLCVRPFSGYLVDCFSRKPLYVFAFTIFACLFAGYWFAMTVYTIMAVRFIQGGFMGLTSVSGNTITIDVIPSKRRGEGMGFYGLTINLAMSLAPLVAVGLYDRHGFFWIIGVALVIALVGIGSVGLIRYPKREKVPRPAFSLDRFILVKALPAALAYLLVAIPYGMLLSFVVLYGKEIEVPDPGYFFIFMAIGVGTARLISGRLVDHGKIHRILGLFGDLVFRVRYRTYIVCLFRLRLGDRYRFWRERTGFSMSFRECRSAPYARYGHFYLLDLFRFRDGDRDVIRRLYRYPCQSGYRLRSRGGLLPSFLIRLYPLGKSLVREE